MTTRSLLLLAPVYLLLLLFGYNARRDQAAYAGGGAQRDDSVIQAVPDEVCKLLSGNWAVFETPQGVKKEMCGDLPCGYVGPLNISCDGGRVSGSALLSVDSKNGKDYRAPVSASWGEGKLTLKHTDSLKCLITYTVSVEGTDLIGEYEKEDCGGKNTRGGVVVKKEEFLRPKKQP